MGTASLIKFLLLASALGALSVWLVEFRKRRQRALLIAFRGVSGLCLAEILLRLLLPQYQGHDDFYEPDPELGWRFRPKSVSGGRDTLENPAQQSPRPPGRLRSNFAQQATRALL